MKSHGEYKEKLLLYFYDELDEDERLVMEAHLRTCAECQRELKELEEMKVLLQMRSEYVPDPILTEKLKERVMQDLQKKEKLSFEERLRNFVSIIKTWYFQINLRPRYQLAAAMAIFLIGILVGKLWLSSDILHDPRMLLEFAEEQRRLSQIEEEDLQKILATYLLQQGKLDIDKVELADEQRGEVSVNFESQQSFTLSGKLEELPVKKVVLYTLLRDNNAANRLKVIRLLEQSKPDENVRRTLNRVVLEDSNEGIRLRAVRILSNMPPDDSTIQTLMKSLLTEYNEGVRIEIIKAFEKWRDPQTIPVLAIASTQDENAFVRERSRTLLESLREHKGEDE